MTATVMKPIGAFAYYVARGAVWLLCTFFWRMQVKGLEHIPASGPFILAPVHRSNIDGPITVIFTKRRMKYLAKQSMFKFAPAGRLFDAMGAIGVERGTADRQSIATCLQVLEEGYPLVLFPEGGRRAGNTVTDLMEGAVYMAAKAGVPIVPVGIGGSEEANPKGKPIIVPVKVACVIGEPMHFVPPEGSSRYPRAAIRESTQELFNRLQTLFDESLVLAGRKEA